MKQCKKAGTIAAAAIGAAAAGYLFLIAPGRSRAGQRFPFRGQNIAHRGLYDAAQGIPENSLAAFRAAAEGGYGAELDTRLTKDGVVVVSHDSNIRRMTGADVTVESLDYAGSSISSAAPRSACLAFRTRSTFSLPRTCP